MRTAKIAKARSDGNQFIALQHTALHMPVAANLKHRKDLLQQANNQLRIAADYANHNHK
jgi:hypothetical protein